MFKGGVLYFVLRTHTAENPMQGATFSKQHKLICRSYIPSGIQAFFQWKLFNLEDIPNALDYC
jgi:hypothetical protein